MENSGSPAVKNVKVKSCLVTPFGRPLTCCVCPWEKHPRSQQLDVYLCVRVLNNLVVNSKWELPQLLGWKIFLMYLMLTFSLAQLCTSTPVLVWLKHKNCLPRSSLCLSFHISTHSVEWDNANKIKIWPAPSNLLICHYLMCQAILSNQIWWHYELSNETLDRLVY